jgi:hypothetical protein
MGKANNSINAKAATINLANILSSIDTHVRQTGLILLLNTANDLLNHELKNDHLTGLDEIRITLGGEIFVNGKKIDPNNLLPGYKIVMDRKESKS